MHFFAFMKHIDTENLFLLIKSFVKKNSTIRFQIHNPIIRKIIYY